MSLKIVVDDPSNKIGGRPVKVQGELPNGMKLPITEMQAKVNSSEYGLPDDGVLADKAFSAFGYWDAGTADQPGTKPFIVKWRFSSQDANGQQIDMGELETKHTVYVAKGDVQSYTSLSFESVVNIASRATANLAPDASDDQITDAVWAIFTSRDVHKVQPGTSCQGSKLYYYGGGTDDNGGGGSDAKATQQLLKDEDGQCDAWACLFRDVLSIHGIQVDYADTEQGQDTAGVFKIWPKSHPLLLRLAVWLKYGSGAKIEIEKTALFINNWSTSDPNDLLVNRFNPRHDFGIPGQGNDDPPSMFNYHAAIRYNGKIYDPSYGQGPYITRKLWEDQSLAGCGYRVAGLDEFEMPFADNFLLLPNTAEFEETE